MMKNIITPVSVIQDNKSGFDEPRFEYIQSSVSSAMMSLDTLDPKVDRNGHIP